MSCVPRILPPSRIHLRILFRLYGERRTVFRKLTPGIPFDDNCKQKTNHPFFVFRVHWWSAIIGIWFIAFGLFWRRTPPVPVSFSCVSGPLPTYTSLMLYKYHKRIFCRKVSLRRRYHISDAEKRERIYNLQLLKKLLPRWVTYDDEIRFSVICKASLWT